MFSDRFKSVRKKIQICNGCFQIIEKYQDFRPTPELKISTERFEMIAVLEKNGAFSVVIPAKAGIHFNKIQCFDINNCIKKIRQKFRELVFN